MAGKAKSDAVTDILKTAEKKYNLTVGPMNSLVEGTKFITTGNIAIDNAIGGGIPLGRSLELYGPPSCGKSLDLDAPVLTPDRGFVRMGDLQVGDRVVDPEGDASNKIVGIYPQGVLSVYRLTFSDGTWAESSGDHLWDVWRWVKSPTPARDSRRTGKCSDCGVVPIRARGLCITCYALAHRLGTLPARLPALGRQKRNASFERQVLTTDRLRELLQAKRARIHLPVIAPFDFDAVDLPLDPYLVGALLGDGSLSGQSIKFTSGTLDSPHVMKKISQRLPEGMRVSQYAAIEYGLVSDTRPNPLRAALVSMGINVRSYEKFIPENYKHSSHSQRLELLQGLLDTDGNWKSGAAEFTSTSQRLMEDVVWVARSLGMVTTTLSPKKASYVSEDGIRIECRTAYRCVLRDSIDARAFTIPRKMRDLQTRPSQRRLVSVDYVGERECQCIKVSAASELFITNDFIPTHNTTTGLQGAAELQKIILSGGDPERGIFPDDRILYLDYEQAMDKEYARALGLDVDHDSFLFTQPDTLEDGCNLAIALLNTGKVRLVIFDSLASMNPSAKAEAEIGKSLPAVQAKLMADFGMTLNSVLRHNNAAVIYLNHEKEVMMGMTRPGMPAATTTPGGKATKYFASVRVQYRQIKQIKGSIPDPLTNEPMEVPVATDVKIKVTKNKVAPPFREASVRVRFGRGFDNFWTAMQILLANKKVMYANGRFYFHNVEADGFAPDWMPRETTGTKRPYLFGEKNLFPAADRDPAWRLGLIRLAEDVVETNTEALNKITPLGAGTEEDDEEGEVSDVEEVLGQARSEGNRVSL